MWQSSSPYPVGFLGFDSVGETLQPERTFRAERFGNLDGVLTGLFLREVLREENVRNVLARRSPVFFDGLRELAVALMSAVTHNLILEEDTDGS